jgi:hypothetical protein
MPGLGGAAMPEKVDMRASAAAAAARAASNDERCGDGPGDMAAKEARGEPTVAALRLASASLAAEAAAAASASGETNGLQAGTRSSSRLRGGSERSTSAHCFRGSGGGKGCMHVNMLLSSTSARHAKRAGGGR